MADLPPYDQLLAQVRPIVQEERTAQAPSSPPPNLALRNTLLIGGMASALGYYGYRNWWKAGFGGGLKSRPERWFQRNTDLGGVDKLGHAWGVYGTARMSAQVLEYMGNDPECAIRVASWSAWGIWAGVEILDGLSRKYRFSAEDLAANSIGALMAYFFETHPEWDDLIDYRFGYEQSSGSRWNDPISDYSGQVYRVVLKAEGIPKLRDSPWTKYLEVSVGYSAPGYDHSEDFQQIGRRYMHYGVSVNLSKLLADGFYGGKHSTTRWHRFADRTLDILQLPIVADTKREIR